MLLLEVETPQLSATHSQTGSDSIITKKGAIFTGRHSRRLASSPSNGAGSLFPELSSACAFVQANAFSL